MRHHVEIALQKEETRAYSHIHAQPASHKLAGRQPPGQMTPAERLTAAAEPATSRDTPPTPLHLRL